MARARTAEQRLAERRHRAWRRRRHRTPLCVLSVWQTSGNNARTQPSFDEKRASPRSENALAEARFQQKVAEFRLRASERRRPLCLWGPPGAHGDSVWGCTSGACWGFSWGCLRLPGAFGCLAAWAAPWAALGGLATLVSSMPLGFRNPSGLEDTKLRPEAKQKIWPCTSLGGVRKSGQGPVARPGSSRTARVQ